MTSIEHVGLGELRARVANSNGLDRAATTELHRREMGARLRGAGRNPHEALAWLERRRSAPTNPVDQLLELYAKHGPTRDPHQALLALHAQRIIGRW